MSVIEDNWDYYMDLSNFENKFYNEFLSKINSLQRNIDVENGFKTQKYNYNGNATQDQDNELKMLIEKNKELRYQIDKVLEEISQQQVHYETYKKDQKLLSQEIKETHEAFLMAKKYYKKFLKMYYTIESRNDKNQIIFVQFFTESKKDVENYSVRFQRNSEMGIKYQLMSTTPMLTSIKELQGRLQETNDVSGALCCIRQAFIDLKTNKK